MEEVLAVKSIYDIFDNIQVSVFVDEVSESERVPVTSFITKNDIHAGEGRCFSLKFPEEYRDRYLTTLVLERWDRPGRIGNYVTLKIGHPGQVFTRKLENLKVDLDSKTHVYLAKPTAQILLNEDEKSACSSEMFFGFDACYENTYANILKDAGGCTPPWVPNKTSVCDHSHDWDTYYEAARRRVSLFMSHRYHVCPRPCATMKGNLKFVTEVPIKHCKTCGTFGGNDTLKKIVPEGASDTRIIVTIEEEFQVTRSFFAYTPIMFFAEIGGYLGLFIGYSLVSFADFFSWLLFEATNIWRKRVAVKTITVKA